VRIVASRVLRCLLSLAALLVALPAGAQDPDAARLALGRAVYETRCGGCHYERLHDRPRERSLVKSEAELRTLVIRRAGDTGQRYTSDEIEALVRYLDRSHYRFAR
jgi:mono/diheme cytochrome c family protein